MSRLTKEDWKALRKHGVAFRGMPKKLFDHLLDKVYGVQKSGNPGSGDSNPSEVDETDAMMFCLAHSEPGIQPEPPPNL